VVAEFGVCRVRSQVGHAGGRKAGNERNA
jgi:hypothetical protein